MITWFWPEIVQDLSLLQIASAAKSSGGIMARKRQLACALQFCSTLAAPYGRPAQGKVTAIGTHVFYRYVLLQRFLQAQKKRKAPSKAKPPCLPLLFLSEALKTDTKPHDQIGVLDLEAGSSDSEDDLPEAQYLVDDEGAVYFEDAILDSLEEERSSFIQSVQDSTGKRCQGKVACMLCPFRTFSERRKLLTHLRQHHTRTNQFSCSGTKQIKVILSLHDSDCARRKMEFGYLQRSAAYLRQNVDPPLPGKRNAVDRYARLLFTAAGPIYCNERALGVKIFARRVRNIY